MKTVVAILCALGVMHLFIVAGLTGLGWGILAGLIGGAVAVTADKPWQS